jgi:hypothetical protein
MGMTRTSPRYGMRYTKLIPIFKMKQRKKTGTGEPPGPADPAGDGPDPGCSDKRSGPGEPEEAGRSRAERIRRGTAGPGKKFQVNLKVFIMLSASCEKPA